MTELFPKASTLRKKFNEPINSETIEKSIADKKKKEEMKTRPKAKRTARTKDENRIAQEERDKPLIEAEKAKLIEQLFDENKDIPIEEMLTRVIKTGKTVSSLKGVRETLEDIMNIEQLSELISTMRKTKIANINKKNDPEEEEEEDNSMMTMLPFLQKMKNGGLDSSQMDPTMLALAMGSQGKGKNNMGQLFFMMSMANLFAGNQQQNGSNNKNNNQNPNLSMDMIKGLYNEFQSVIKQQQQPAIDPTLMLVLKMMQQNQNQKPNNDNGNIAMLIDKFNTMINNNQSQQMSMLMQQSNDKFERGMELIAGALNREKPEDRMYKSFELFRNLQGDSRAKSKDEMVFDIENKKLDIEKDKHVDILNREERQIVREDAKSGRLLDTAEIILNKVVGQSIGALVSDISNARGGKKNVSASGKKGFDATLLDEL